MNRNHWGSSQSYGPADNWKLSQFQPEQLELHHITVKVGGGDARIWYQARAALNTSALDAGPEKTTDKYDKDYTQVMHLP